MMDAPLAEAVDTAKSILKGDFVITSTESKIQFLDLVKEQVQRLMMKPGEPIPLGLSQRQRYEILIFLMGAASAIQGGEG